MFAARDQENLVSIHQATANNKQQGTTTTRGLQPKTPGARYPKTPLKVPLNDENVARGLGGKNVLADKTKVDKSQWVTPAGKLYFLLPDLTPQHLSIQTITAHSLHSQYVCSHELYRAPNWSSCPG